MTPCILNCISINAIEVFLLRICDLLLELYSDQFTATCAAALGLPNLADLNWKT